MTDTACPECGREASHYQDCPGVLDLRASGALVLLDDHEYMPQAAEDAKRICAFADCGAPLVGDKRTKYCEDHKDPKNRKE